MRCHFRDSVDLFFFIIYQLIVVDRNFFLICCHLQTASERVSQMETVWIMMEKLAWNNMNIPQVKQSCGELLNSIGTRYASSNCPELGVKLNGDQLNGGPIKWGTS